MKNLTFKNILLLILISLFFISCEEKTSDTVKLDSGWKYSLVNPDVEETELKILNDVDLKNLQDLIPSKEGTIYLTKTFLLPDSLQKEDISCFLGRIEYSDRTYLNHYLIGSTGYSEDHRYSCGREPRFYEIPEELLIPGINTITIEIYVQNTGFLKSNAFIATHDRAKAAWISDCFWNNHLYLILACIILFLGIYSERTFHNISEKKDVFFYFILCFLTALNLSLYFITQIPLFDIYKLNYSIFIKVNLYLLPSLILFTFTLFLDEFFDRKAAKIHKILRAVIFIVPQILYFVIPTRFANGFISILPYAAFVPGLLYIAFVFIAELAKNKRNSFKLAVCISPVILFVLFDLFFHTGLNYNYLPYLSAAGWPVALIVSIFLLSTKKITELKEEISTLVVPVARQNVYAQADTEGQTVIVPPQPALPEKQEFSITQSPVLDNYEIAYCFNPSREKRTDMYECFRDSSMLQGIALFETSKLNESTDSMTELSKRLVSDIFVEGKDLPLTKVMQNINSKVLREKGEYDNSLTGILLRVFDSRIEYVNVGHVPAMYRNERGTKCMPVLINSANYAVQASGTLGIEEVSSDYRGIGFTVNSGDSVFLYSSSFENATNLQGDAFGQDRVRQAFLQSPKGSAEDKLSYIMNMFQNYTHDVPVKNDLTVILLQKK